MYKAIIFDLYGTLLDIHTDESQDTLWEKLSHFYGIQGAFYTPESLKEAYINHVALHMEKRRLKGVDFPDIDLLKVFKQLYKVKNISVTKRTLLETARFFRILSLEYIKPYPGAVELLTTLKALEYKVLLLSNAQASFTMDELAVTGIEKYFDGIYLSSDYKVAKPSQAFYQVLLDHEHLLPEECLFIGNDHTTDIAGAHQIGMDSIYIQTNCSQSEVPDEIPATWRIDSGNLFEVIALIKAI